MSSLKVKHQRIAGGVRSLHVGQRKDLVAVCAALAFGVVYCTMVVLVRPIYLDTSNTDPLAMIHALFPYYFVLVPSFTIMCLVYGMKGRANKYICLFLLCEFSLILWFTPYYLSGFSRHSDALFHVGVSNGIPQILSGQASSSNLYRYGKEYPLSFVFNYVYMKVTGVDMFVYSRLLYPFFSSLAIAVLWFVFSSMLFNVKAGFISTVFAMLGLAYLPEIHASPHALGTVLAMVAVIFLTRKSSSYHLAGFFAAFSCVLAHPESPIILIVFIASYYVTGIFFPSFKNKLGVRGILAVLSFWFAWTFFNAIGTGNQIAQSLYQILSLKFLGQLQNLSSGTVTTTRSMYPEISALSKVFTYSLVLIPMVLLFQIMIERNAKKGALSLRLQFRKKIGPERFFVFLSALLLFVFAYAIVFVNINPGTGSYLERGYSWFVFAICAFIAAGTVKLMSEGANVGSTIFRVFRKYAPILIVAWFLFLSVVYPLTAFANEATLQYPNSEGAGMTFLSYRFSLEGRTVSMFPVEQMMAYVNSTTQFKYLSYNDLFSSTDFMGFHLQPDLVIFRKSMYFRVVLSYDFSLNDNRYLTALNEANNLSNYNKVYSSSTFEVYLRR